MPVIWCLLIVLMQDKRENNVMKKKKVTGTDGRDVVLEFELQGCVLDGCRSETNCERNSE